MTKLSNEQIAEICHEANRVYCRSIGDDSQVVWSKAFEWQQTSAIEGVRFHIENPDAGAEASHTSWMDLKLATGWVYGETKDVDKRTHPCIVPYTDLPLEQRLKDELFVAIVRALSGH